MEKWIESEGPKPDYRLLCVRLSDELEQLRARNAELEKYNTLWHEIADVFVGKKLDTHLGDKICIIGWKRDELSTRNAVFEAEVARMRKDYMELIMQVSNKFTNESRHQTALRYIRNAENSTLQESQHSAALEASDG